MSGGADPEGAAPTLVCLVELRVAASYGLEVAALKPIASITALGLLGAVLRKQYCPAAASACPTEHGRFGLDFSV